jgi:hypothetical protein
MGERLHKRAQGGLPGWPIANICKRCELEVEGMGSSGDVFATITRDR